jgi:fluoroacetyl-CoA thioesterase
MQDATLFSENCEGGIMKETLQPGIEYEYKYRVPASKTVPGLYPEAEEFRVMPDVFATGFLVEFIEWVCIQALKPHIDWPLEQTVGTQVNISHMAATPPGMEIFARVKLVEIKGKQLFFEVEAYDEAGIISKGSHERFVINAEKFNQKLQQKIRSIKG